MDAGPRSATLLRRVSRFVIGLRDSGSTSSHRACSPLDHFSFLEQPLGRTSDTVRRLTAVDSKNSGSERLRIHQGIHAWIHDVGIRFLRARQGRRLRRRAGGIRIGRRQFRFWWGGGVLFRQYCLLVREMAAVSPVFRNPGIVAAAILGFMRQPGNFCLLLCAAVAAFAQNNAPHVVTYKPKMQDLKFVYGAMPPVLRVRPGDVIDTTTVDADGHEIEAAGLRVAGPNPLTGPFYVEGAEPGDTLVVRFLAVDVNAKEGFGSAGPGFGALNSSNYTPVLGAGIAKRSWTYPIDKDRNVATFHAGDSKFSVQIPLHPFLGCVGVAPGAGEMRSSIVPAEFGGNMDSPEASAGNTLYLPVKVAGALLFLGDGHAAMGDGEVDGTAIEISMHVQVQVSLLKHQSTEWPRFENANYIMAAGIYRPLDDALRIAFTELIRWIHKDYGLSEMDAYELLSKTAEIHLNEMVDPNYVIIAKINKKFLPPPRH